MILFGGGGGSSSKPKKEEKKERKNERDEKYEVQELVFTRWANAVCEEASQQQRSLSFTVQELKDVADLKFLSAFLYLITGNTLRLTGNQCDDIDTAFHLLISFVNLDDDKLLQLSINEICDGVQKALLMMCWQFIQIYWKRFASPTVRDKNVTEVIRDWSLDATSTHDEVRLTDFKSSWRDGIALNVILYSHNNSSVDLEQVRTLRGEERLDMALNFSRKHYKVPKVIYPKEFSSGNLDTKSVVCYLMMLYLRLHSLQSPSSSQIQASGSTNLSKDLIEISPPNYVKHIKQGSSSSVQSTQAGTSVSSLSESDKCHQKSSPSGVQKKYSTATVQPLTFCQTLPNQFVYSQVQSSSVQQYSPRSVNSPGLHNSSMSPLVSGASAATISAAQHQQQLLMQQDQQVIQQPQTFFSNVADIEQPSVSLFSKASCDNALQSTTFSNSITINPHVSANIGTKNGNDEVVLADSRSRQSSSSSQKSSGHNRKSLKQKKQHVPDDVIKEYESCLEQVLTWLLEAERELDDMNKETVKHDDTIAADLSSVKKKFQKHEQFMQSLTESQDSVGRVLHRGHQLSQKPELDGEKAAGILNQLHIVNERWEHIRETAMHRQQALQNQLSHMQRKHLKGISDWLTQFEQYFSAQESESLANDPDSCRQQILNHARIQEQIDFQQPNIHRLSSFIVVESELNNLSNEAVQLEELLQNVGKRWARICEWAEQRAQNLDGLAELLEQYNSSYEHLYNWLNIRKNELSELCSIHDLKSEEQVFEQMQILHKIESQLESEHSEFVKLSQFCSELVQRYKQEKNIAMAEKTRTQLDSITETWDSIVSRLEEHSQMLLDFGKASLKNKEKKRERKSERSQDISETECNINKGDQFAKLDSSESETKKRKMGVDKSVKENSSSSTTDSSNEATVHQFLNNVNILEQNIQPLIDWAQNFILSTRKEDIRQMIQVCQQKLKNIKEIESHVTKLQIELERIHHGYNRNIAFSSRHLHIINQSFEQFMFKWSKIVSKISDSLNALSNPGLSNDEKEPEIILIQIADWLKSTNVILDNLRDSRDMSQTIDKQQQKNKLEEIAKQLIEQQNHLSYFKRRFPLKSLHDESMKDCSNDSNQNFQQQVFILEDSISAVLGRINSFNELNHDVSGNHEKISTYNDQVHDEISEEQSTRRTTVVQMKQKLQSTTSGEKSPTPNNDNFLLESSKPQLTEGNLKSLSDSGLQNKYSLDLSLTEAELLRKRLELDAIKDSEEVEKNQTQTQSNIPESSGQKHLSTNHKIALWIAEQDVELKKMTAKAGDIEDLKSELTQCDVLIAKIREKTDGDEVEARNNLLLRSFLESVETKRNCIVDNINTTQLAIHKYVKAEQCADRHKITLDRIKMGINEMDLHETVALLKDWPLRNEAISTLEEISFNTTDISILKNRISFLTKQWDDLNSEILHLIKTVEHKLHLRAANALDAQMALLSELQEALKASVEATDAEELSEHLDNLERLLEGFNSGELQGAKNGNWVTLEEHKKQSSQIDAVTNYYCVRDVVIPIARDRCERLRSAITKCDYFEQALCNCQSWCSHMHHILNLRISSDIHALDVPHEYKQAFDDGTLIYQMDKEFAEYDKLIQDLDDFIETNKTQWSSNDRLRLQSEHAKSQLLELKTKYNEFKQPILLDDQIDHIQKNLSQIECEIDDLTGIQAENCRYGLTHCEQLRKQLGVDGLLGECSVLENSKDVLIRENVFNESQAIKASEKIVYLQNKCAQLEERTISTCDKLARCVKLIENLEKENESLEKTVCKAEECMATLSIPATASNKCEFSDSNDMETCLRLAVTGLNKIRELELFLRQNSIRLSSNVLKEIEVLESRIKVLNSQFSTLTSSEEKSDDNFKNALLKFETECNNFQNKLTFLIEHFDDSIISNTSNQPNLIFDEFDHIESAGLRLSSEIKNSELNYLNKKHEYCSNISENLSRLNALRQIYVSKNVPSNLSTVKNQSVTPVKDDFSLALKNETTLPELTIRKQSDVSIATINDASSISSHSDVELSPANIVQAISDCLTEFDNAQSYLDFKRFPIYCLKEWKNRLDVLKAWITENKPHVENLLASGKDFVKNGKMEMKSNDILPQLDNLEEMEMNMTSFEDNFRLAEQRKQTLQNNINYLQIQVDNLKQIDMASLNNVSEITAIQREHVKACNDLQNLRQSVGSLNKMLLSNDQNEIENNKNNAFVNENNLIQGLNEQLNDLEERIQNAILKALCIQEEEKKLNVQSADRASLSSGAGLSLAMDVQETEPEDDDAQQFKLQAEIPVPRKLLTSKLSNSMSTDQCMDQFFVNLDTIEEYFDKMEHLSYEGIEEKLKLLEEFEAELLRGERLLQDQEMTMGFDESQHSIQRIATARNNINERRTIIQKRRNAFDGLESQLSEIEKLIVSLGLDLNNALHNHNHIEYASNLAKEKESLAVGNEQVLSRDRSPDFDELESSQLYLEDQLPRIAIYLQQSTNKLNAMLENFSVRTREIFENRIKQCNTDFTKYSTQICERRCRLEERLTNQTYLNNQLEMLEFWCDETEAGVVSSNVKVSILSPSTQINSMLKNVLTRFNDLPEKLRALSSLENVKNRFVALPNVDPEAKHEIRRNIAQIAKRISDLKLEVNAKLEDLQKIRQLADEFWNNFKTIESWLVEAVAQIDTVRDAKIYQPSLINIDKLKVEIPKHQKVLDSMYSAVKQEIFLEDAENGLGSQKNICKKSRKNQQKFENLLKEFNVVTDEVEKVLHDNKCLLESLNQDNQDNLSENVACQNVLQNMADNGIKPGDQYENSHSIENILPTADAYSDKPAVETDLSNNTFSNGFNLPDINNLSNDLDNNNHQCDSPFLQRRPRRMSVSEQARLDTITRFGSWLEELQREVAITVDISDQHIVRQGLSKAQNWLDELNVNQIEVFRVIEEASDRLVLERAQLCSQNFKRILELCQYRRNELQLILEGNRAWEQLRISIDIWINEAEEKLASSARVNELTDTALVEQLALVSQLSNDSTQVWRERLSRFNIKSNELLDTYRRDDGHNLSHLTSKLNTQWTKFNDALRIRRAVLEATQRSRSDFHSALGQLQHWLSKQLSDMVNLEKASNNLQLLKDTCKRRDWMAQEKEARLEIDAHCDLIESVRQMGKKLLEEQDTSRELEQFRNRLQNVNSEWQELIDKSNIVKRRLENAQEECESLTQNLSDFLYWTDQQLKTIANAQPVGGDLSTVQAQFEVIKTIERTIDARERQVQDCIQLAHSYLMQHDLRPAIHTPLTIDASTATNIVQDELSALTETQKEERRIGVQIYADSKKLGSQWELLKQQCINWSSVVSKTYHEMHELDATIAEALLALGAIEDDFQQMPVVENLRLEELKDARTENLNIRKRVHDASTRLDDVNDCSGQIVAKNIALSTHLNAQIYAINQRFEKLKNDVGCRGAALERAFNDFGPSSEHFLIESVEPPWQRAITIPNQLPYYIDHNTEVTQWDHPTMVDILEQLSAFNQVKFSAYRTAMKLRAMQKRLCLDLIELSEVDKSLQRRLKDYNNEDHLRVEDAIMCLSPLFEMANERFPHFLKNVPLAVDLALNLLLNIYDADGVDQKALAILFYDLIHIPKFLGESAAFGGLNIEPSVRSCFEHTHFALNINVDDFLNWLKKEPQSFVWLPVMHRLASSEFAKHQAKCNACKMFPIVGLRYRCLRCFNFDICQNCFFSQRTAKNHKLNHPMQEYCLPTNSRDDMRDFTAMVRNKVRRSKNRIGYLPVEQVIEGVPLEQSDSTPQNSDSEAMHQRMHLFAQRLDLKNLDNERSAAELPNSTARNAFGTKSVSMGAIPFSVNARILNELENEAGSNQSNNDNEVVERMSRNPKRDDIGLTRATSANAAVHAADIKSPLQVMAEADQAQKEEMDQLLQKLQYENMQLKKAVQERKRAIVSNTVAPSAKSTPNLNTLSGNAQVLSQLREPAFVYNHTTTILQQQPRLYSTMPYSESYIEPIYASNMLLKNLIYNNKEDFEKVLTITRDHHLNGQNPPCASQNGPVNNHVLNNISNNELPSIQSNLGVELDNLESEEHKKIVETRSLRLHQQRLEQRSRVLEEHNRQLQQQLERLQNRLLIEKEKSTSDLPNQLEITTGDGIPPPPMPVVWKATSFSQFGNNSKFASSLPLINDIGNSTPTHHNGLVSSSEDDDFVGRHGTEIRRQHMQKLMSTVEELNRAMESFVVSVVVEPEDNNLNYINEEKEVPNENDSNSYGYALTQLAAN